MTVGRVGFGTDFTRWDYLATMYWVLHDGHEHTETGVSAAGNPELFVMAAVGVLLVVAVMAYAVRRYA